MLDNILAVLSIIFSLVALVISFVSLRRQAPQIKIKLHRSLITGSAEYLLNLSSLIFDRSFEHNKMIAVHEMFSADKMPVYGKEKGVCDINTLSNRVPDDCIRIIKTTKDQKKCVTNLGMVKFQILNNSSVPVTVSNIYLEQDGDEFRIICDISSITLPLEMKPYGTCVIEAFFACGRLLDYRNARKTSSFRARMNSAILVRRLLLFDIFANDIKGSAPATATEITGRPKRLSPQFFKIAGECLFRTKRLETPLRLLTRTETDTLGG